ncbi:MAG: tRNA dimethylallyltransferase [candidate division TA06 bacterium ADurb.Bin417]|uniref:tRNA dimethylallyltransferase n=1 Tax=candidate division TA06 bacterium ADurb.Bin417 TaxID=1852828 RepID=A0A1V5MIS8_UNCT6|nr:MAG: tRNA dimethylallyltransferase [candidate division TA06 bacterium ADurb.Bin417]
MSGRPTVELYRELSRVDPVAAARIQPNDAYRIRRALEVFQAAGRPISRLQSERIPLDLPFIQIGVWRTREEIYRRIEKRVDEIFAAGFLEEVAALRRRYDFSQPAFEAIGYREAAAVLDGELNLEQARRLIAQKTRNYAKRQLTWFRKDRRILWLDFSGR